MSKAKTNTSIREYDYFRVVLTIGKDAKGNPIQKQFYGTSKPDAENKRTEYIKSITAGLNPDLASQSLVMAMHTWLWEIERRNGNKSSTFERYEGIYRNYVENSDIGILVVSEIRKIALQKHYNKMLNEGKTYSQIINLHKLLNKFFNYAEQDGYVIKNPCRGVRFVKNDEEDINDEDEVIETFSKEELKKITSVKGHDKMIYISKFALFTGARRGEILALKIDDLKSDNSIVRINKSVKRIKVFESEKKHRYEVKVTRTKTESSVRENPIPEVLKTELKKLSKLVSEEKLKLGPAYNSNGLLFPSTVGTYIDVNNFQKEWKDLLKEAGVSYKKFHALRHTYATNLFERGVDILTVSRLLGHKNIQTTEIYTHVLKDIKVKEVECLNDLLI
jgi:integrase